MIEVREVIKKYCSITVLNSVSMVLRAGEVVGLLGPNGAGKTTLIKILAGLIEPTKGEVLFNGENINNYLNEYKSRVGYLPENPDVYPHLTGFEYLELVGNLRSIRKESLFDKIHGFMRLFQLENDMHSNMGSYSKGMKQKVLLSSALLHNPDILILDEPLSGLDTNAVLIFRDLIKRLKEEGKIILYSSHLLEEVERICSRVIILHKGCILADAPVEDLQKLAKVDSLEEVFKQLVISEDSDSIARDIIYLMRSKKN